KINRIAFGRHNSIPLGMHRSVENDSPLNPAFRQECILRRESDFYNNDKIPEGYFVVETQNFASLLCVSTRPAHGIASASASVSHPSVSLRTLSITSSSINS
ncbi:MAG: hypothetical protein LBS43_02600, partial [Prevotellaceae bacterium]|nr:hypothetical protein [Prevotellaceae bacterium]